MPLVALLSLHAQSYVPVGAEPHHHLKFENRYVRVFDVLVPAGDATLFHLHPNDYVFVTISGANLKAQIMGRQPTDLNLKTGDVRFSKAPLTHRVVNVGQTPFRNLTVEILSSPGSATAPGPPENVTGYTPVLENERVRVYRLILEPGQSTGAYKRQLSGLSVTVSSGKIMVESAGRKHTTEFEAEDFRWHTGAATQAFTNVGTSRFEAVEIEWK